MTVAVAVGYHGLVAGGVLVTTDVDTNDLLFFNYPNWVVYAHALRHGHLLQWAPGIQSGFPVFAEGQGGFLYPPTMLLALLFRPIAAINAFIVVHAVVMGMGVYRLAARLTSPAAAWGPSVAGALCGSLMCGHTRHLNALAVIALSPWLFHLVESYVGTWRRRISLNFGIAVGLTLLAGHPQFAFISVTLSLLYLVIRSMQRPDNTTDATLTRRLLRTFAFAGTSILIALVIAWPQLHATLELLALSNRGGHLSVGFFQNGSLAWSGILTFVDPYYAGNPAHGTFRSGSEFTFWEGYHYVGVTTFALAIFGVFTNSHRSPQIVALACIAILSFLFAVGSHSPIHSAFQLLPIVGSFRIPARWLLGTELSILFLAAFGCREVISLAARRSAMPQLAGLAVAAVVLIDVVSVSGPQIVTAPSAIVAPILSWVGPKPEGDERLCVLGEDRLQRRAYETSHGWSIDQSAYIIAASIQPPNLQMLHGVSSVIGYTSLSLQSSATVWGDASSNPGVFRRCAYMDAEGNLHVLPQMITLLRLWHVGQVRSVWPLPPPFKRIGGNGSMTIYTLPDTMPRAWVVPLAIPVAPSDDLRAAATLVSPRFQPRRMAIVSGPAPTLPSHSSSSAITNLVADDDSLTLIAATSGLVVISDTWYPDWRCTVDGVPAPIYRVDTCMRGIVAPRRGAVIRMSYVDRGLPLRLICSLSVYLVCLIGLFWPTRQMSSIAL